MPYVSENILYIIFYLEKPSLFYIGFGLKVRRFFLVIILGLATLKLFPGYAFVPTVHTGDQINP